jgi:type III pantothenate kinase
MLLTVDIGNTNVELGIFDGEELRATWRMATDVHHMPDEYAALFLNLLQHGGLKTSDITEASLCSVVAPLTGTFKEMLERYFSISPLIIGAGVKTGVRILLDNPREVGADRIVTVAAAHKLYGGPLVIVDMGTATTFDAVNKEGDFLGGAIAPGIGISSEALFSRTAALPRVELKMPKNAIGASTVAAMRSGIVFGYIGLVEGVVNRIKAELGGTAKVVGTGGYSSVIAREAKIFDILNPDLILIGLRHIYLLNKESEKATK